MTRSKTVFVERPNEPVVAPGTVVLFARDNQLYMKTDAQEVIQLACSADDITAIKAETDKIDSATTDGLAGTSNSLAYRVHEIERHFHSYETWLETAAVPNGEIHVADRVGDGNGAFQIDADNDDWGAWVQILGSSDTPQRGSAVKFDLHRLEISATEHNEVYFVHISFGASGNDGKEAGDYTEAVFKPSSNQVDNGPVTVQSRRIDAGTKAWARCKCPGQNTATLDFFIGLHEYSG